ncbi:translation initiation factor IF-2-like [Lutra lutra]|uniref:translation initiation factor IF-2-like n=1 Tax=Lutra lutra TaxID=9657 RepID=UPI001FD4775E|nr:translation initiation factor IF-2-like [Lutra lutra]
MSFPCPTSSEAVWAAAASCAAASAGEWSALEFEQGPEPSQRHLRSRPPPPSSNSRSLRHSASHRPRAAVRPHSQSRGSLLKPPRRRRSPHAPAPAIGPAAAPDGSCSPGPRGPYTQERGAGAGGGRNGRDGSDLPGLGSHFQLPAPPGDPGAAGEGRGLSAGSCVNRFPPRDTPVSREDGLCSCARPAGAAARERGGGELAARNRPQPGLADAGPAQINVLPIQKVGNLGVFCLFLKASVGKQHSKK